jgi:glycogen operon protein
MPLLQSGLPTPFGALARDGGVNFAVFSDHASAIDLCVFDANGKREVARHRLHGPDHGVFHGFLPDAKPGLIYGYRAYGDYASDRGLFFNPAKLLLDPYATDVIGPFHWRPEHHAYEVGQPDGLRKPDARDNASIALKARVTEAFEPAAAWKNAPRVSKDLRVLYEVHVKGFSQTHPGIPEALRGTYAALAHPEAIAHFKQLGVTTLSLLPVQLHLDEEFLTKQGRSNYWGYNTLAFFAINPRWSQTPTDCAAAAQEFQAMVHTLHTHGIEVFVDVVFNHTAEGNQWGPSLSFRGLDNPSWYRLDAGQGNACVNWSGCGNTLNMHHPRVMQFVLDSLRHLACNLGVDGFRFDLAPVLGRTREHFESRAPFFQAISQDPILSQVCMVAEPWDMGPNGYQVGGFPAPWLEWNDKFRDAMRGYWLGRGVDRAGFARRFLASSDVYQHARRQPSAGVNFVAVHDGFTAADVVTYSHKDNLANGENNRDGRDDELCNNFGAEGPTSDASIAQARSRVLRGMLATLALAQGTPMFAAGDEMAKTQGGNNNAYCQDAPLSWLDWSRTDDMISSAFTCASEAIALRRSHPALRYDHWFVGPDPCAAALGRAEVTWHLPNGQAPNPAEWHDAHDHALACCLTVQPQRVSAHAALQPDRVLLMFNPHAQARGFVLPAGAWQVEFDSSAHLSRGTPGAAQIKLGPQCVVVLAERGGLMDGLNPQ